jgi:hypothetical protein
MSSRLSFTGENKEEKKEKIDQAMPHNETMMSINLPVQKMRY